MKTPETLRRVPPILVGAGLLAALSLVWSGYAITDLMHSGRFGLSVAVAGDIGWLTVLWAEYRGVTITIGKRTVDAATAGWAIALGVAVLLGLHGHDAHSLGQTIAGPFVVLVGKAVWAYALASLRDPAALTPEQLAEIHAVMRDSEYAARLHHATLDRLDRTAEAEIARIRTEARITLARDDADFQIGLERLEKRAEIQRKTPIAIAPITPEQHPSTIASSPEQPQASERPEPPATSPIEDREKPSIIDLAREQVAITPDNRMATKAVLALRPDAEKDSVSAAVRKARREANGGYN